jgi:uncharacterized protein (TIGR03437 family)
MAPGALAQPRINGVVNGASFTPGVAAGSFASIFGENLAPAAADVSTTTWPTTMGGVSVLVNGRAAPLHAVRAGQINFQVPASTPAGNASVEVRHSGQSSAAFTFSVVTAAPGIILFGSNRAVVQNQDLSLNNTGNGALPGSTITAYMTGQGVVDNAVADGAPAGSNPLSRATLPASATIGGQSASISFLGLSPGFVGLLQANIVVPALPAGDHPLVVTIGGRASNNPVITVRSAAANLLSRLHSVDLGANLINVLHRNGIAYACGNGGINVVNASDPTAMRFVNAIGVQAGYCGLKDNLLVSASGGQGASALNVYSLDRPEQPARIGGPLNIPQFAQEMIFSGNYAHVSSVWFEFSFNPNRIFRQHGDLHSINLTDAARPTVASTMPSNPAQPASSNESPFFSQLRPNADTLYLLSTTNTNDNTTSGLGRLVVVDTANAANPAALSQLAVPRTVTLNCGAIEGSTALVVGNTSSWTSPGDFAIRGDVTLTTFDISDARNPRPLATVVTPSKNTFTGPSCVSLGGGWFAYSTFLRAEEPSDRAIVIVDARDRNAPAVAQTISVPNLAERGLSVVGETLFALTNNSLISYRISR